MYKEPQLRQLINVWKFIALENVNDSKEYQKKLNLYAKAIEKIIKELSYIENLKDKKIIVNRIKKLSTNLIKQFAEAN